MLQHNTLILITTTKRTENGYPLTIEVTTIKIEQSSSVDKEFLLNLLPKINYNALKLAVQQISSSHCSNNTTTNDSSSSLQNDQTTPPLLPELPEELDVSSQSTLDNLDDTVLSNLYKVLFDVYVIEGQLVCPDTGRKFPVKDGIPNMILHEDEI